jgi:hypothetical protein
MTLAGNIEMLKPIQNTGISHYSSAALVKRRNSGALSSAKCI